VQLAVVLIGQPLKEGHGQACRSRPELPFALCGLFALAFIRHELLLCTTPEYFYLFIYLNKNIF
jgi:hypothetical protein